MNNMHDNITSDDLDFSELEIFQQNGQKINGTGLPHDDLAQTEEELKEPEEFNQYRYTAELIEKNFERIYDTLRHRTVTLFKGPEKENPFRHLPEITPLHVLDYFKRKGINVRREDVTAILLSGTYARPTNDIQEYLSFLRGKWKPGNKSHIEELCKHIVCNDQGDGKDAENMRMQTFLRKWTAACVANTFRQYTNPVSFIIESEAQGIGKSSLIDFMFFAFNYGEIGEPMHELNRYATRSRQSFFDTSHKSAQEMRSHFLINFDEMTGFEPKHYGVFRQWAQAQKVEIYATAYHRLANFAGSFNRDRFQLAENDRRFAVFPVIDIDQDYVYKVNLDAFWAEAVYYFEQGAQFYKFLPSDWKGYTRYNEQFVKKKLEEIYLNQYFRPLQAMPEKPVWKYNAWRASDIIDYLWDKVPADDRAKLNSTLVGMAASKQRWFFKDSLWSQEYGNNLHKVYFCEPI